MRAGSAGRPTVRVNLLQRRELRCSQRTSHLLAFHTAVGPGNPSQSLADTADATLRHHQIIEPSAPASRHRIDALAYFFPVGGDDSRFSEHGDRKQILSRFCPAFLRRRSRPFLDPSLPAQPPPNSEQVKPREHHILPQQVRLTGHQPQYRPRYGAKGEDDEAVAGDPRPNVRRDDEGGNGRAYRRGD